MSSPVSPMCRALSAPELQQFEQDGYFVARGLLGQEEVAALSEHFMEMQRRSLDPTDPVREHYHALSLEEAGGDILKHFPRIMHPARFDSVSRQYMLDSRLEGILTDLLGEQPLAAQSMLYFKPPGARGQALHQDNFYLNVRPGTCMAAWVALDPADAENGGMFVVPGSHKLGVLCPRMADMAQSFTTEQVDIPEGMEAVQLKLEAGDVLFFNGSVIHGSTPNSSQERFRRAFICHYVGDSTTAMNAGYFPLCTFSGETINREGIPGVLNTCGAEDWDTYQKLRDFWLKDHMQASGVLIH